MRKEADRPLVEYVKDAWKSLEIVKYIKILDFEYNTRESSIDINNHIFKREKSKKKKDCYPSKFINDDRVGCLTTRIQLTITEIDPKTKQTIVKQKTIKKDILVPIETENGCYFIKGKNYYMIYQLTEKSTYTSSRAVILKSLMPVSVQRTTLKREDYNGDEYNLPVYNITVFRKSLPVMLFYAANEGIIPALDTLQIGDAIQFKTHVNEKKLDKYLYFQISAKLFLRVRKKLFMRYPYIQSVVGGLLTISSNRLTIDQLYDKDNWIKKLGTNNKYEKGKDVLVFFNRMLDETTRKVLNLDPIHTENIYTLLRWLMQNYNELRMKDNLSLDNKRLRCNEYVASLLTQEFSRRLNKIISLGNKATMIDLVDIFRFSGEILIQKLHSSGVLRFDESINDMTFFRNFKYTTKGRISHPKIERSIGQTSLTAGTSLVENQQPRFYLHRIRLNDYRKHSYKRNLIMTK